MIEQETIDRYHRFRGLCLLNAAADLNAATLLVGQSVNHVAYHAAILAMEEIGKIFVAYHLLVNKDKHQQEEINFGFDDHIRKLFWAVWGPSLGEEVISKEQITENQGMAKRLHEKRLGSLYTALEDTKAAAEKISNDELESLLSFVQARLTLAQMEGEVDVSQWENPDQVWFDIVINDPARRRNIFDEEAQVMLAELGNLRKWMGWLRSKEEKEKAGLAALITAEMQRLPQSDLEKVKDKWKIKVKLSSPSHTVRANILEEANKHFDGIQLFKGADNQTLLVEFTFGDNVSAKDLWAQGWLISKLFVAALNVCTNAIFYWNIPVDLEKYYESIRDVENNRLFDARLMAGLQLNWGKRKRGVDFQHLVLTKLVFEYFVGLRERELMQALTEYLDGLGLMAKSDIHSRFEPHIFNLFFSALKRAITSVEKLDASADITEPVFRNIEKMVHTRETFNATIALGYALQKEDAVLKSVTLAEIVLIKQYAGFYLMTLAIRKLQNNDTLLVVLSEGEYS